MSKKRNKQDEKSKNRRIVHRRSKPGDAPGLLTVDPDAESTHIRVMAFGNSVPSSTTNPGFHASTIANQASAANGNNCSALTECVINNVDELKPFLAGTQNVWIDVTGLGSQSTLQLIADLLHLHPLAMEDVVHVHQRAKVDEFPESLFVVSRMFDGEDAHQSEQISFFLLDRVLVTFQERPGDCWDPVRQRIRLRRGKFCDAGVDYLLYALLDSVIDSYFPVMERLAEHVDTLELAITEQLITGQMRQIHDLRGQLLSLRKAIRPHREMINELIRDSNPHVSQETRVHLRDCYDHVIQVLESVDTYRELTSDLRDFYLSSVSNSMNEVMKVLTIISTIFIPLSFIAGVYGMNFDTDLPWNMPELHWEYGYAFSLALMALVAFGLLVYFRRRRWI